MSLLLQRHQIGNGGDDLMTGTKPGTNSQRWGVPGKVGSCTVSSGGMGEECGVQAQPGHNSRE